MADAVRIYGSRASTDACSMSRAWRKELAHLLARGPRPGIEIRVANEIAKPNARRDTA